ncbi:MAG TPA: phosphatase PAP2 family protein [Candidatus Nanoarchaeia archaeon]
MLAVVRKFKLQNLLTNRNRLINLLLVGYLVIMIGFMLSRNMAITPDRFFVILLFGAVIVGRTRTFLKDWVPFIALLLAYELLRGFADTAGFGVHVGDLVSLERSIFGFIPTVELQRLFFNPAQIAWWDIGAVLIDFLHFPLPLLVAFYLWVKDRRAYWKFIIALLALSFAGFTTYLLFPAAPPWWASQKAHLIEVHKVVDYVVAQVGWGWDFSQIYNKLNPNPVAAMPSLHAAYPTLAFLALFSFRKKIGLLFLPYPFLVWLSVVYLGEHYVIDVIAGIIYAVVIYLAVYQQSVIRKVVSRVFSAAGRTGKKVLTLGGMGGNLV